MTTPAFTTGMKYAIAGLTTILIGLGSWLGVVVYRNAQREPAASIAQTSTSESLPAPVSDILADQPDEQVASTPAGSSKQRSVDKQPAEKKGESSNEAALTATVNTRIDGGSVTVSVKANLSVTAWFSQCRVEGSSTASCSGALMKSGGSATEHALTVDAGSGKKVVAEVSVRSAGGQLLQYDVVVENLPGTTQVAQPNPTPTATGADSFAASVSTTSSNGQTWLLVTASEPVRIGVDATPSGELSATHRRSIVGGRHTVTLRTADGREQSFTVVASSSTSVSSR